MTTCTALDGAAIVQMFKPGSVNNFAEYASQVIIPYISSKFQKASRIGLVWNKYIQDSLKYATRAKREKGVQRCVVTEARLPSNWMDFLHVDCNKIEQFKFLSNAFGFI